jgi:hypothetical protein
MEIKPTCVTFEQAKLLKEKGFDVNTDACFHSLLGYEIEAPINWDNDRGYLVRPEQWQVVEWLRVKYKVFIGITITYPNGKYFCRIINDWTKTHKGAGNFYYPDDEKQIDNDLECYNSPQEAYSAAFDYVLTKLI